MSSQATVHSVEALKDFRVALALYSEDTLGALGAIEAEVRRTVRWLEQERPAYWQDQIKRRRELVSQARAEVFRKNLQKRPDYTPPMSEQKENLRKAEASLQDAEKRLTMVRKWQPSSSMPCSNTTGACSGSRTRRRRISRAPSICSPADRCPGGLPPCPAALGDRAGVGADPSLGRAGIDRDEDDRRGPGRHEPSRSGPRASEAEAPPSR